MIRGHGITDFKDVYGPDQEPPYPGRIITISGSTRRFREQNERYAGSVDQNDHHSEVVDQAGSETF
jgi:hypothetical protein